jgi:DNA (cytosine-5)-methyltransferase 1
VEIEKPEKPLTVGSLCTGYAGLELGLGRGYRRFTDLAWYAEVDPAAIRLLRHRFPEQPNLGDVRLVDYAGVEPVDILTLGVPCQPVSFARRGDGPRGDDDPRWLWPQAHRALKELQPRFAFFENVRGLLSAKQGELWRQILADFRQAGYKVTWGCLGACAVGAPHHRHRVWAWAELDHDLTRPIPEPVERELGECGASHAAGGARLLPTPVARDGGHRSEGVAEYWAARAQRTGKRQSPPLAAIVGLLPDGLWGEYEPTIRSWETQTGQAAPARWVEGKKGGRKLNPAFPEWMMGLPQGWVTRVPGLSFGDQRKLLGNGVCPAAAAQAIRWLSCPEREVPKPAALAPVPAPAPREPRQEAAKNWGVVYSARLPQEVVYNLERLASRFEVKPGTLMRQIMTKVLSTREHLPGMHLPGEEIYACWGCEDWRTLVRALGGEVEELD